MPPKVEATVTINGERHPVQTLQFSPDTGKLWRVVTIPAKPLGPYYDLRGEDLARVEGLVVEVQKE